jgi:hypothetical protein
MDFFPSDFDGGGEIDWEFFFMLAVPGNDPEMMQDVFQQLSQTLTLAGDQRDRQRGGGGYRGDLPHQRLFKALTELIAAPETDEGTLCTLDLSRHLSSTFSTLAPGQT